MSGPACLGVHDQHKKHTSEYLLPPALTASKILRFISLGLQGLFAEMVNQLKLYSMPPAEGEEEEPGMAENVETSILTLGALL